MSEGTIYRKDYQASAFTVSNVALDFDLYDDHVIVNSRMQMQRKYPGDLCLYGDELELKSIHLDGEPLPASNYRLEQGNLILKDCPDDFSLHIVTRIYPQKNTKLMGLFRSHQLFCTQCESQGFRRMTFFLDRPDVLATYTTRICADKTKYPILLSNGNLADSGETDDGRHWVVWHDPFKKPSYLFALVAGDLVRVSDEFITASGRKVDLHIYVEPGNEDKCEHAMASLKRCMRWDEEAFGREYDLDIFMIVAVSDFNMGAMENKGLNIFNSKYILARADTATDQDYADIEGVVGHEYFHNWTGNRVTCRDWFQLSLKEGLTVFRDQEFSRDMNSRDVFRILDVKVLRNIQFPEDAGRMAHPVRPDSYQEINNFYTATVYNKGAEVIRMQQTLLGKAGFRRGMDLYFERHDGQAVTIDDFVAAMEDANGVQLSQFKRWYSQAGTPEVSVTCHYHQGRLSLNLRQSCPATPECEHKEPFHIPLRMALYNAKGQSLPIGDTVLELREEEQSFHFDGLSEQPLVSLLRDFSAPIVLHFERAEAELLSLMRIEQDGFAKWDAALQLALTCMKRCYHQDRSLWAIPKDLIKAYRHVLQDESLDKALRAELLSPPGFEDVVSHIKNVDVEKVEDLRDVYQLNLGKALFDELMAMYHALWQQEDHGVHAEAYARRKLRNTCLNLLMKADEKKTIALCQEQFAKAKTMSDQLASFSLLVDAKDLTAGQKSIQHFYQQWQNNELVLDKWFAIQASADQPDVLERVKDLLAHKDFNIKNPNKVRALVGSFTQNARYFHAIDGSGYELLTDVIITLDKLNPQLAARLATPFTRWQRYDAPRQKLIKQQLKRLANLDLSRDMRELVVKSLDVSK